MVKKAELRKSALILRKGFSEEEVTLYSNMLLEGFKTLNFDNIHAIHIFLPIQKNNEPNTLLIIDWLGKHHPLIKIIISITNFKDHSMTNYVYRKDVVLVDSNYGIPEPVDAEKFLGVPEMVLVPLLAFDLNGFRVGYGKGFYDRFLANIKTKKIGISFFEPVDAIADVDMNDIRLDYCITPNQIYTFKQ